MKTQPEIKAQIAEIEQRNKHILTGSVATIRENAPRALMQLETEAKLHALHWVLGTTYKSKLKGNQ